MAAGNNPGIELKREDRGPENGEIREFGRSVIALWRDRQFRGRVFILSCCGVCFFSGGGFSPPRGNLTHVKYVEVRIYERALYEKFYNGPKSKFEFSPC